MSRQTHACRPGVEGLEDRVPLSISIPWVQSGVLNVVGNNANDRIRFSRSGGDLVIEDFVQYKAWHFNISYYKISRIDCWARGGNDIVENYSYFTSRLIGGDGDDQLTGGFSTDQIWGGNGRDILRGGYGNDVIYGGAGNDTIYGQDGNDVLVGEAGNDYISGGAGNDRIWGGPGQDTMNGWYGYDLIVASDDNQSDVVWDYRWEPKTIYLSRFDKLYYN